MGKIRVALCDDHNVILEGLGLIISQMEDMSVVATAGSGTELLHVIEKTVVDVVVLDLYMKSGGGIETLGQLSKNYTDIRVIILSVTEAPEIVHSVMQSGAMGYVSKRSSGQRVIDGIRSVFSGRQYLDPSMAPLPKIHLTSTELIILEKLRIGMSPKEIAAELGVAPVTIYTHQRQIAQKFGITTDELVIKAIELGILPREVVCIKKRKNRGR